ncbi:unnamed protein product [Vitrella brassicaformis CCMP3155]|uniref:Uncharacterized protein n=1 Tax=Vitrella brassicaformis (strain CCMP3155) TaxID=1169540 RepID=A0A0G4EL37_VITBC|nr:unnamed protein product [Vitrella brassicaformis CCMP3155]|eukprot:CEL97667.1 unnamed protein product [Vitrella brassicaformis CCMP3155]
MSRNKTTRHRGATYPRQTVAFDDRVRVAPSQSVTVSMDHEASPGGVLCRLVGLPSTIHSLEDQHSEAHRPTAGRS